MTLMEMAQTVLANRPWCKPSSKSGSDWTEDDLTAFKITFEIEDSASFFGIDPLPDPAHITAAILTDLSPNERTQDRKTYRFLGLMTEAMRSEPTESGVLDFVQAVLQLMHYDNPGFLVRSRVNVPFLMCSEWRNAQTNLCVVDKYEFLLFVQEDKQLVDLSNPEAQLVGAAVAAFDYNNRCRGNNHLPILKSRIIPGITMWGTTPRFYKIPITQDLVDCVRRGEKPIRETKVSCHYPSFPDDFDQGMVPLGNRLVALKCYEAFKAFVFPNQNV